MAQAEARSLAAGRAEGQVLVLAEPLSLWGGVDPATGAIVDRRHPQREQVVSARVLVMPGARGSSSSSSVLAECVRAGTAPAAILLGEPDAILAIGSEVAAELYGLRVPVVLIGRAILDALADGDMVAVEAREDGTASVSGRRRDADPEPGT